MKVIAVLALIFAASEAASTSSPCNCKGIGNTFQGLNQITSMLVSMCNESEDVAGCKAGLVQDTYWPALSFAMFAYERYVNQEDESVCGCKMSDSHNVFQMKPTCDQCKEGVATVASVMGSEGKLLEIVNFLKGHENCAADEKCIAAVDLVIPAARPALATTLVERSEQGCCEFSRVCCS